MTGDPSLRVSYPFVRHPAVEIRATKPGDLKWVEPGFALQPCSEIKAVRFCYQLSSCRSFILRVRLQEPRPPEALRQSPGTWYGEIIFGVNFATIH
jgi:hypothetical protein